MHENKDVTLRSGAAAAAIDHQQGQKKCETKKKSSHAPRNTFFLSRGRPENFAWSLSPAAAAAAFLANLLML